jgi:hypothetical protein
MLRLSFQIISHGVGGKCLARVCPSHSRVACAGTVLCAHVYPGGDSSTCGSVSARKACPTRYRPVGAICARKPRSPVCQTLAFLCSRCAYTGTVRFWVHAQYLKFAARIPPEEQFFKAIPVNSTAKVLVTGPPAYTLHDFATTVVMQQRYHRNMGFGALLLVPVTGVVGFLIPFPNILLGVNLFRLFSHYKAWAGSSALLRLLQNNETEVCMRVSCASLFGFHHQAKTYFSSPG